MARTGPRGGSGVVFGDGFGRGAPRAMAEKTTATGSPSRSSPLRFRVAGPQPERLPELRDRFGLPSRGEQRDSEVRVSLDEIGVGADRGLELRDRGRARPASRGGGRGCGALRRGPARVGSRPRTARSPPRGDRRARAPCRGCCGPARSPDGCAAPLRTPSPRDRSAARERGRCRGSRARGGSRATAATCVKRAVVPPVRDLDAREPRPSAHGDEGERARREPRGGSALRDLRSLEADGDREPDHRENA